MRKHGSGNTAGSAGAFPWRRGRALPVLLCLLLLSCSCGYMPSGNTEDLLVAPRLNARQAEVYRALESTLNLSDISYKYPQSGEYRSPFVFYDLDGDGQQEAIVFYAYNEAMDSSVIRAKILKEVGEGEWISAYDIAGSGDEVAFIRFANLLDRRTQCLVIGWQSARRTSILEVFSLGEGKTRSEVTQVYSDFLMADFSRNGLSEILTIQEDGAGSFAMSLYGRGEDGRLQELDHFFLAEEATHIYQMTAGRLWDDTGAVYIDELLDGRTFATEVVRVQNGTLEPVAAESGGEDFTLTFREEEELCTDLEGDGLIEVPLTYGVLPGQEESEEIEPLTLTEYRHLTEDGFEPVAYAVSNRQDSYQILYPARWLDQVTVIRRTGDREWLFYKLDEETGLPGSTELLRIRVYSVRDYKDKFTSNYELLTQNGLLEYYAYIPANYSEPLAVGLQEVRQMFRLLD